MTALKSSSLTVNITGSPRDWWIYAEVHNLPRQFNHCLEHGQIVSSSTMPMILKGKIMSHLSLLLFFRFESVMASGKDKQVSKDALLKSYRNRLKEDIESMVVNFTEIVKLCKVEDENQVTRAAQCEEDAFEMQVRAANMVRAGESLMKLISDLKQFLILNDFPTVNETIAENSKMFLEVQETCDRKLTSIRDELATDLFELEDEYYSSTIKSM